MRLLFPLDLVSPSCSVNSTVLVMENKLYKTGSHVMQLAQLHFRKWSDSSLFTILKHLTSEPSKLRNTTANGNTAPISPVNVVEIRRQCVHLSAILKREFQKGPADGWLKRRQRCGFELMETSEKMFNWDEEWNISFAGCGFRSIYYLGALSCILERVPQLVHGASKICGASSGCLVAAALAVGLPIGKFTEHYRL